MVVFFRGLRDGVLTTRWPRHADKYFDEFPAAVEVLPGNGHRDLLSRAVDAAARCPSAATAVEEVPRLDRGRCILCGRCVATAPNWFGWTHGSDTARLRRESLVVTPIPETHDT